jgi:hypothetical protein
MNFLGGQQEAEAFERGEYVRLHQSTLRKVDILANILGRTYDNTLKTNARWYEIYGISPSALGEIIKEHWLFAVISFLAGVASIIGLYVALKKLFSTSHLTTACSWRLASFSLGARS